MRRYLCVGALAAIAVLGTACSGSSGGSPSESPTAPSSTPPPTTSAAPTTTAPSTPTPSPTAAPLSKFENDPGVKALRAFAAQAARTLTSGHAIDAKLNALVTPAFAKVLPGIVETEVGKIYPGPNPFTPVKITSATPTQRNVNVCWVAAGWSLDPKTHKVAEKYQVVPVAVTTTKSGNQWRVAKFADGNFSCLGVKIVKQKW